MISVSARRPTPCVGKRAQPPIMSYSTGPDRREQYFPVAGGRELCYGAGRNFSRRAARERFTVEQLAEAMRGIEWRATNAEAFLDEIPSAYKDIDQIMEDAKDLVTVDHTLRQVLNVKGD
jgi:hypothetical protein